MATLKVFIQSAWMIEAKKGNTGAQQKKIVQYLNTIIEKSRSLAMRLRPATLDVLGLTTALKLMFSEINENNKLKIVFYHGPLDGLRFKAETINVFRIIQEVFANILKHAKASRVDVKMTISKGGLKITIHDNGKGFVPNGRSTGLGLATMQERAKLLGGTIKINSRPRRGTFVLVGIPLMNEGT